MERAAPCCSRPAISSAKSRRGADERDTAFQPASQHVHPTINDAFLSLNRKFCDVAVTRHVNATVRGGAHTGSVGNHATLKSHTHSLSHPNNLSNQSNGIAGLKVRGRSLIKGIWFLMIRNSAM